MNCDVLARRMVAAFRHGIHKPDPGEVAEFRKIAARAAVIAGVMEGAGYVHSDRTLEALARFYMGYGVGITGGVGTGKTFFFESLISAINEIRGNRDILPWKEARATVGDIRIEILHLDYFAGNRIGEVYDYLSRLNYVDVVFDDLGVEEEFNDYGSKFFLLSKILNFRMNCAGRTCWTTNLTGPALAEFYQSDRVIDRLKACGGAMITLDGPSRRKPIRRARVFG